MVAAGLALAFVRYSSAYVSTEAEARQAKRGVWAGTFDAPWDYRAQGTGGLGFMPQGWRDLR